MNSNDVTTSRLSLAIVDLPETPFGMKSPLNPLRRNGKFQNKLSRKQKISEMRSDLHVLTEEKENNSPLLNLVNVNTRRLQSRSKMKEKHEVTEHFKSSQRRDSIFTDIDEGSFIEFYNLPVLPPMSKHQFYYTCEEEDKTKYSTSSKDPKTHVGFHKYVDAFQCKFPSKDATSSIMHGECESMFNETIVMGSRDMRKYIDKSKIKSKVMNSTQNNPLLHNISSETPDVSLLTSQLTIKEDEMNVLSTENKDESRISSDIEEENIILKKVKENLKNIHNVVNLVHTEYSLISEDVTVISSNKIENVNGLNQVLAPNINTQNVITASASDQVYVQENLPNSNNSISSGRILKWVLNSPFKDSSFGVSFYDHNLTPVQFGENLEKEKSSDLIIHDSDNALGDTVFTLGRFPEYPVEDRPNVAQKLSFSENSDKNNLSLNRKERYESKNYGDEILYSRQKSNSSNNLVLHFTSDESESNTEECAEAKVISKTIDKPKNYISEDELNGSCINVKNGMMTSHSESHIKQSYNFRSPILLPQKLRFSESSENILSNKVNDASKFEQCSTYDDTVFYSIRKSKSTNDLVLHFTSDESGSNTEESPKPKVIGKINGKFTSSISEDESYNKQLHDIKSVILTSPQRLRFSSSSEKNILLNNSVDDISGLQLENSESKCYGDTDLYSRRKSKSTNNLVLHFSSDESESFTEESRKVISKTNDKLKISLLEDEINESWHQAKKTVHRKELYDFKSSLLSSTGKQNKDLYLNTNNFSEANSSSNKSLHLALSMSSSNLISSKSKLNNENHQFVEESDSEDGNDYIKQNCVYISDSDIDSPSKIQHPISNSKICGSPKATNCSNSCSPVDSNYFSKEDSFKLHLSSICSSVQRNVNTEQDRNVSVVIISDSEDDGNDNLTKSNLNVCKKITATQTPIQKGHNCKKWIQNTTPQSNYLSNTEKKCFSDHEAALVSKCRSPNLINNTPKHISSQKLNSYSKNSFSFDSDLDLPDIDIPLGLRVKTLKSNTSKIKSAKNNQIIFQELDRLYKNTWRERESEVLKEFKNSKTQYSDSFEDKKGSNSRLLMSSSENEDDFNTYVKKFKQKNIKKKKKVITDDSFIVSDDDIFCASNTSDFYSPNIRIPQPPQINSAYTDLPQRPKLNWRHTKKLLVSSSDSEDEPLPISRIKKQTPHQTNKLHTVIHESLKKKQVQSENIPILPVKHYSFLGSLTLDVAREKIHPDALPFVKNFKKRKEDLTQKLYDYYNSKTFDNCLPKDMNIKWNPRMTKSAGFCYYQMDKSKRSGRGARIELSTKVIDCPARLRDTLIHELCHAASWIISGYKDGHGPLWKSWASKARKTFPELPPINRCHSYEIRCKYTYKCTKCGYSIGRHSKSLDTMKKVCGLCYGKFELIVNKLTGSSSSHGTQRNGRVPATPRTPNPFALFVKENYGSVKKTGGNTHREVMKTLGEQFAKLKTKGD